MVLSRSSGTNKSAASGPVPSFKGLRASSSLRTDLMRRNTREGGRAERALRSELWRRGRRFRKHAKDLPGTPDLVFESARLCVFVDGDFWHGRQWTTRRRALASGANSAYWLAKIFANRERDRRQTVALRRQNWNVVRLWETDVLGDLAAAASLVERAMDTK